MSQQLKLEIIRIGRLLWDKGLVSAFNGNISARLDDKTVLITATGTCLGFLSEDQIITMTLDGQVIGEGKASSERLMHGAIYQNFPKIKAIVHTHTTYTNGYFLANEVFKPRTFEAQFYLGQVRGIEQTTPSVTDVAPVIEALKANNILALRNHGVVAGADQLFNAFVLIQELEEQVKTNFVEQVFSFVVNDPLTRNGRGNIGSIATPQGDAPFGDYSVSCREDERVISTKLTQVDAHRIFSNEHIQAIVNLVNNDPQMQELGSKTSMNMSLAVILDETKQAHRFVFEQGRIKQNDHDPKAEFVINAPETIWRAVFKGELDPFVATTQKKMTLTGDFARISKWYAPCSRIFQLWTKAAIN